MKSKLAVGEKFLYISAIKPKLQASVFYINTRRHISRKELWHKVGFSKVIKS